MAINTPTTSAENRNQEEVLIQKTRAEALKKASTVGGFQSDYKRMMSDMMEGKMPKNTDGATAHDSMVLDKEKLGKVIKNEQKMVEKATEGNEQMGLEDMEGGVLGYNTIGEGREGAKLNRAKFHAVEKHEDALAIKQVAEHEAAHGDQVELTGELVLDGKEIDPLLVLEGHAEIRGNEGIGQGMNYHRDNQPEKTYAEGQRLMAGVIRRTSREEVERVLTQTGDLSELQALIDREKKAASLPIAIKP